MVTKENMGSKKNSYRDRQRSGSSTPADKKDYWCTPKRITQSFILMSIRTDIATNIDNPVDAPMFFTEEHDSLNVPWNFEGLIWCNPPFSKKSKFLNKAATEWAVNGSETVILLPASVGSKWFQPAWRAKAMCFVEGRQRFLSPDTMEPSRDAAMFDIVLVYFGDRPKMFRSCASLLGKVVTL